MMEYPRFPISELHLVKFQDCMEFLSNISTFDGIKLDYQHAMCLPYKPNITGPCSTSDCFGFV